jgi:hypothetical protein
MAQRRKGMRLRVSVYGVCGILRLCVEGIRWEDLSVFGGVFFPLIAGSRVY